MTKILFAFAACLAALPAFANGFEHSHDADEEAERIRQARLEQMADEEKYLADPEAFLQNLLRAGGNCKYVSSINSAPPSKRVALTFDDGPDSAGAAYVLEVLQKYDIPATFFVKGSTAKANSAMLDRVARTAKVIVGNHSWSHPNFHTLSSKAQAQQIRATDNLLGSIQSPKYFRYPYGNSTCESNRLAHALGYKIVGWHIDSCDWGFNKTGRVTAKDARICGVSRENMGSFRRHVVDAVKERRGGILLMHDVQRNTIRQLDLIVAELLREGYTFGSLNEAGFQRSLR